MILELTDKQMKQMKQRIIELPIHIEKLRESDDRNGWDVISLSIELETLKKIISIGSIEI